MRSKLTIPEPNPSGLCMCGCGNLAPIARQSDRRHGWVKDRAMKYIVGHAPKVGRPLQSPDRYIILPNGCWEWQGHISDDGYGIYRLRKTSEPAHRMMYRRLKGPIPPKMDLHHQCENRRCVNPDHLRPLPKPDHAHVHKGENPPRYCTDCGAQLLGHNDQTTRCRSCHKKSMLLKGVGPNPGGLCLCGCGMPTSLARQGSRETGNVRGAPVRFIPNHHRKPSRCEPTRE